MRRAVSAGVRLELADARDRGRQRLHAACVALVDRRRSTHTCSELAAAHFEAPHRRRVKREVMRLAQTPATSRGEA